MGKYRVKNGKVTGISDSLSVLVLNEMPCEISDTFLKPDFKEG